MGFIYSFDGVEFLNVESVQRSGPQAQAVEHTYPGVDGVDSVVHGFRGETITLNAFVVSQTPDTHVEQFRSKARSSTVGVLSSTKPGFTDITYARIDSVNETGFEGGDDGFYTMKFTVTFKQIKENDA